MMSMSKDLGRARLFAGLVLAGLLLVGCKTHSANPSSDPVPQLGSGSSTNAPKPLTSEIIGVGDSLTVVFSDLPGAQTQLAFDEKVKSDGTVTLLLNQTFVAAGKIRADLEREIRKRYVPDYYKYLTVTIKPRENTLFYYVGGEVKQPNREVYNSRLTLTKAIQSAGDFTDFAKRTKVKLTRNDGRTVTVNCKKILDGKAPDPEIFPGDKIWVPRRIF
jgi:protein involved in polysaccharide export with SLBB domain